VHDEDVGGRQRDAGIQGLDSGVVPLRDLAEEDLRDDVTGEPEGCVTPGTL